MSVVIKIRIWINSLGKNFQRAGYSYYAINSSNALTQCFPTFLGLRHVTEGKYNLRLPVESPEQFASRFDDILKIVFATIY